MNNVRYINAETSYRTHQHLAHGAWTEFKYCGRPSDKRRAIQHTIAAEKAYEAYLQSKHQNSAEQMTDEQLAEALK